MADDSEEKPSAHDFSSTKAAILDTFNKLKRWREEQVEQFRNLQYLESQKLMQLSGESQKQFEKLIENAPARSPDAEEKSKNFIPEGSDASSLSMKNDLENYDTLLESSITAHLQRCFDDSSSSNPLFTENKTNYVAEEIEILNEAQNFQISEKKFNGKDEQQVINVAKNRSLVKTKRPFLRKGTGLLRYMPKASLNGQSRKNKEHYVSNTSPKKSARLPQKTLKLKSAFRKTETCSENVKHIRFDIPATSSEENVNYITETNVPLSSQLIGNEVDDANDEYSSLSSGSPDHGPHRNSTLEDVTNSECEGLNMLKENKELEEFEMLENCAQNSSFNSDSSVVQRILHADLKKSFPIAQKEAPKPSLNSNVNIAFKEIGKNSSGNSIFSPKIGLSKCLEEAHARKEILQKVISDINPRIQSLQKEISRSKQEALDESDIKERCSTPINVRDRITPSPENDYCVDSPDFHVSSPTAFPVILEKDVDEVCQSYCKSCNIDDDLGDFLPNNDNLEEEDSVSDESEIANENKQVLNERSKIRNKLQELEKEIEIYQELNAKLSSTCKERNEFLKKLQKEREDFNKYKEAEKKKLEAEIEEERRQIKRQKETFTRYQKLRRDNPTRKEREELNSLRQEIEKLQEEIKRQKIKYTSDSRRWKTQLETAEREKDNFKLENIRLEEQCQDLLSALKTRIKKRPDTKSSDKTDGGTMFENSRNLITKDAESQTLIKDFNPDISKISKQVSPKSTGVKKTKAKVRFNLSPEYQEDLETVSEDVESRTEIQFKGEDFLLEGNSVATDCNKDRNVEKDTEANLSTISVSAESEFKEIDHGNKIERIYVSGEREIIFHSGTRKIITADGEKKFLFYNGDVKEIFPDKHEIYRYVNGITETHFPDGLEVVEFPNGRIQKRYPDGHKEVTFTDGTVHNVFADSSEEIRSADGNVVLVGADGTKTIEFANGQREIRTKTYKRREFPDGAVKIIYDSGRQETRYPNGRIRIKDKEGKVLFDTKYLELTKD